MISFQISKCSKVIALIALCAMFLACSEKKEHVFRYSNGTEIKDSVLIGFLNKQLPIRIPEYDSSQSLIVQTYLDTEIERKLNAYFQRDSLRKVCVMVVIENNTGNVVYCQNSEKLLIYSPRFRNTKIYGMLMSFEKGVRLTDTFSWVGKQSGREYKKNIQSLYRIVPPSTDYKYPFDNYSLSRWNAFLNKLDISINGTNCTDGGLYPRFCYRISLFDLVKTCALIQGKGYVKSNNLFGMIQNIEGTKVHTPRLVKGSLLKEESCIAIEKVLNQNVSDRVNFHYPVFLDTENGKKNGMIFSTNKYTVGFVLASKSVDRLTLRKEIGFLASLF